MTREQIFFLYLIECYAAYKDERTSKVYEELESLNLISFICDDMYWRYSTEAIENAFKDIDKLIAERKAAENARARRESEELTADSDAMRFQNEDDLFNELESN